MMDEIKRTSRRTRSYGQFCALARSLDVVGERWTLLIVRELLPGPLRYSELRASLSGIATNLLADRLRALEADGVVERRLGDTGVVYALTPWGEGLREPMEALGRWGAPLLADGRGADVFRPRWLTLALPALLHGVTASPAVELGIEVDGFAMLLRVDADGPSAKVEDADPPPTSVLVADADVVVALAVGAIRADAVLDDGGFEGDPAVLRTVFPNERAEAGPPGSA